MHDMLLVHRVTLVDVGFKSNRLWPYDTIYFAVKTKQRQQVIFIIKYETTRRAIMEQERERGGGGGERERAREPRENKMKIEQKTRELESERAKYERVRARR